MFSLTLHDEPAYIEVEIFDRYNDDYINAFFAALKEFDQKYDSFNMLEIQHGKIGNGLRYAIKYSGAHNKIDYGVFKKLRRYAIVADEPDLLTKLSVRIPNPGGPKMKIYPLHQLFEARSWMEAAS